MCLRPSSEQKLRIKTQFEVLTFPNHFVWVNYLRGAKHCKNQWQKDHWKVKGAKKGEQDHTIKSPLNSDESTTPKIVHPRPKSDGREYCRYLDYHTTIDISGCATWKQRNRYENSLAPTVSNGPHPGAMGERDDFPQNPLSELQLSNVNQDD